MSNNTTVNLRSLGGVGACLADLVASVRDPSPPETYAAAVDRLQRLCWRLESVIAYIFEAHLPPEQEREYLRPVAILQPEVQVQLHRLELLPGHVPAASLVEESVALVAECLSRVREYTDQMAAVAMDACAEWQIHKNRLRLGRVAPAESPAKNRGGAKKRVTREMWDEAQALYQEKRNWNAARRAYNERHGTHYSTDTISGWGRYLRRVERQAKAA